MASAPGVDTEYICGGGGGGEGGGGGARGRVFTIKCGYKISIVALNIHDVYYIDHHNLLTFM